MIAERHDTWTSLTDDEGDAIVVENNGGLTLKAVLLTVGVLGVRIKNLNELDQLYTAIKDRLER